MKKILLVIVGIVLITGCGNTKDVEKVEPKDDLKVEENYDAEYKVMENKLIEYGKLIYDKVITNEETLEPGTYYMTLKDMNEHIGHDISMFVNPKTKEPCNPEESKIEFIVSESTEEGKNNYKFNPVLVCE